MVGRRFVVHHKGTEFPVNYDTENCFEVLKFQIFSLTQFHPTSKSLPRGKGILSSRKNLIWWVSRKGSAWRQLKMEQRRKWNRYNNWGNPMRYWLECCRREFRYFISLAVLLSLTISCLFNLAEEEALFFQQFQASEEAKEFEQRVRPYINRVMLYEDPVRQEAARETVPISEIQEKSLVSLAKEGNFKPSKDEEDHNFLLQLLIWFKQSFSWVNSPPCDDCGRATSNIGMGAPLSLKTKFGASRVELYRMPANV